MEKSKINDALRVSHRFGVDEAHGNLQVCLLATIHMLRSKSVVALGLALLLSYGVVTNVDLKVLVELFTSTQAH